MVKQEVKLDRATIMIIVKSNSSPRVIDLAKRLVESIFNGSLLSGARPKLLQRNKSWLSYRINRRYRLLVERTQARTGPYFCMSHNEFDNWIKRH